MVTLILIGLVLIGAALVVTICLRLRRTGERFAPNAEQLAAGAAISFFDTLGIGSFAPTTAYLKFRKLVEDTHIARTLIVSLALPTVLEALIYVRTVEVDPLLLVSCIAASVIGSLLGASLVEHMPRRPIQIVMGVGLLIAALLAALSNLHLFPAGGTALGLPPTLFVVAIVAMFGLGVLMNLGIGLYAPSLVLLSLLGLDPLAAFPIMMGACAFLMPVTSLKLLRDPAIDMRLVVSFGLSGIPAVLIAAFVVRSLPLTALRWVVVVVVLYAALLMLRSAFGREPAPRPAVGGSTL